MRAEEARELSQKSRVPGAIKANISRAIEGIKEQARLGEYDLKFTIRKSDLMHLTSGQQHLVYEAVAEALEDFGYRTVSVTHPGFTILWGDRQTSNHRTDHFAKE